MGAPRRRLSVSSRLLLLRRTFLLGAFLVPLGLRADDGPTVRAELDTGGEVWVKRDAAVALRFDGAASDGRLRFAVVLGDVDVTELFARTPSGLVYRPELLRLPAGERELVLYRVHEDGSWQEIVRRMLRVLRPGGLEKLELERGLDVAARAAVDERVRPLTVAPSGASEAATFQLGFGVALARRGWSLEHRLQLVAATESAEALRVSTLGDDAPRLDLASWSLRLARGRASLRLGAVDFDGERHLVAGVASRGARLDLPLGRSSELALAATHGSAIVGWDDPLGLAQERHRLFAGRLGVEAIPARLGTLRLEASFVDGSLLPRSAYTGAAVNDAEESRGWGLKLLSATPGGRLRFEGGYARSRFDNPFDPLLAAGLAVVAVDPEERDAFYGELSLTAYERSAADGRLTRLGITARQERVDPLYRSVAAWTQADRETRSLELAAAVHGASLTLVVADGRDNLDRLPNVLTTETRRGAASLSLPFGAMAASGSAASRFLPALTANFEELAEEGEGVPPNSGFNASHVPDQLSRNLALALDWSGSKLRGGVRYGASDQDNRQPGRERADFSTSTWAVALATTFAERLDLGLELAHDTLDARELARRDESRRGALHALLRLPKGMTMTLNISRQEADDRPSTRRSHSDGVDAQWAWPFERRMRGVGALGGQLFLRYADLSSAARDRVLGVDTATESRTVTAGLTLSLR